MHLAYIDDSDTKAKTSKWQVMCGVIVEDKNFKFIEYGMAGIRGTLFPAEKASDFQEFHACELYGGHGAFSGIEQEDRFDAIWKLLSLLKLADVSVVYGAVNLTRLRSQVYASADPLDISFRICIAGIREWNDDRMAKKVQSMLTPDDYKTPETLLKPMLANWLEELLIVIVDECDPKVRNSLQKSYRGLRAAGSDTGLAHFHDDMYFGDSRYSIGIQLADLCSYFIARHIEGDSEIEPFYEVIAPYIVFSQIEPEEKNAAPVEGVPEVRHDDGHALESSTQRDQEEAGSGESGEEAQKSGG